MGFTGKDYTIVAASKAAMRGATILKASDDKTRELNKNTLLAYTGEAGDTGSLSKLRQYEVTLLIKYSSSIRRIYPGQCSAVLDA